MEERADSRRRLVRFIPPVPHERREAVDRMHEFAVWQGQEERHDDAQVDRQKRAHPFRVAGQHQDQARQAGQEQQRQKARVHAALVHVAGRGIGFVFQVEQPRRADQQADAAGDAEQLGQRGIAVGRHPAEDVMVDRAHRGRGEAQQETPEGQLVEHPADLGKAFRRIVAAVSPR